MVYTTFQQSLDKLAWPSSDHPTRLQKSRNSIRQPSGWNKRCRAGGSSQGQGTDRSEGQQRLIVKPLPPVKPAAAPLQPVPIEHSPSYLLRDRNRQETDDFKPIGTQSRDEEPFTGNAVQWAVRRVDAGLVNAENDPPPAAKALINVARGPAGAATMKGVTAAARITVQVGTEALKAAVPVGKWIAQQGFKAAVGGFNQDTSKERRRRTPREAEEDI